MAFLQVMATLAILAAVFNPILAKDIWVGDESGWKLNFNYQTWAEGKEFHVGDRLIFNYTKGSHDVLRVDGDGFQQCAKPDGVDALTSGNDVIPITSPGKKWYICGVGNHCAAGMKLSITVTTSDLVGSPAPSPSSNPESAALRQMVPTFFGFFMAALVVFLKI